MEVIFPTVHWGYDDVTLANASAAPHRLSKTNKTLVGLTDMKQRLSDCNRFCERASSPWFLGESVTISGHTSPISFLLYFRRGSVQLCEEALCVTGWAVPYCGRAIYDLKVSLPSTNDRERR